MIMFIKLVEEQLDKKSETEKDKWILEQAKLLEESKQQGFLMSLSDEKKIMYMPSQREIEEFCEKVESGEIYTEYETHYYEFDDNGRYMDDWKVWHNDPLDAFPFLNRIFRGCHDLLILNEYKAVANILDRVCKLEFKVVESPVSDDFEDDSPFTLVHAAEEGLLSMSISDIGADWVTACVKLVDSCDGLELAKKLIDIFEQPICKKNSPSMLIGEELPNDLFSHMLNILNAKILDAEASLNNMFSKTVFSHEKFLYEKKLERKREILLNIQFKCLEQKQKNHQQKVSILEASWKQIKELFGILRYEQIGDQFTLKELHYLIQKSVGFDMDHLYYFQIGSGTSQRRCYAPECEDEIWQADTVLLADLLSYEGMQFGYLFDSGDEWNFQITVERILNEHTQECEISEVKGEDRSSMVAIGSKMGIEWYIYE